MILALAFLLAAAAETYMVPPGKSVRIPLDLRDGPARIACEFALMSAGPGVRVSLVAYEPARGHRRRVLASTGYEQKGELRFDARAGRYGVLIENGLDNREAAEVFVRLALMRLPASPHPRELSGGRRALVIFASLVFFFGVAAYAYTKLGASLPRRKGQPPPA